MFAVVKTGGHQYTVSQGDQIIVDFMPGQVGDKIALEDVLLIKGDKLNVGSPTLLGAKVEAVIKAQTRNPKIIVFKYRRTKNSKVTRGHRQPVTTLEITKIQQ